MADTSAGQVRTSSLVSIGAVLLVGVVATRCLVAISPEPVFDVDPLKDPAPWLGIGPIGVLVSSVFLLLGSTLVLFGERLSGRGLDRTLLLLALIPLVPISIHGLADAGDLWRGMDWMAAAVGAVAFAHAARTPRIRAAILGALLGVIALLVVRGVLQMFVEHADTIAYFEAHRSQVLHSFGWDPDSVQANLYERRLRQPEADGWFGLANIFSALMAIGFVLLVGGLGRGGRALASGSMLVLILLAVALGVLLVFNGSKGALVAVVLGLLVTFAPLVSASWRARSRTLPGSLALFALALAIGAVILRGLLGETALGDERSLLFRWHYLIGASRMLAAHPWLGVGPGGFQEAYLFFKPATSPEDPTSAHDVLVDWVATLGILGTAWIGLLAVLALRAGRHVADAAAPSREVPGALGLLVLFPVAIIVAAGLGIWFEFDSLSNYVVLIRAVAVAMGLAVFLAGRELFQSMSREACAWCLGGAMATLLALGGIDMLFTQPGSLMIAWAFLGTCSCARDRPRRVGDMAVAIVPVLLAAWLSIVALYPQWAVGSRMEQAARGLRALGQVTTTFQMPPMGLALLDRAGVLDGVRADAEQAFSALPPGSPLRLQLDAVDWESLAPGSNDARMISADLARRLAPYARRSAIDQLRESVEVHPRHFAPAWASIEQLRLLAGSSEPAEASVALLEALVRVDDLSVQRPGARSAITAAWVLAESGDVEVEPDREAIVAAFEDAVAYSPYDPTLWVGLADAARDAGNHELEIAALEQALATDQARSLDPLVQMGFAQRSRLNARLAERRDQSAE